MDSGWCKDVKNELQTIENVSCKKAENAPFELLCEFLVALNNEDFRRALALCEQILVLEPNHETCKEFRNVLATKIEDAVDRNSDSESVDSNEDSDTSSSTDSENESTTTTDEEEIEADESIADNEKNRILNMNLLLGGLPVNNPKDK